MEKATAQRSARSGNAADRSRTGGASTSSLMATYLQSRGQGNQGNLAFLRQAMEACKAAQTADKNTPAYCDPRVMREMQLASFVLDTDSAKRADEERQQSALAGAGPERLAPGARMSLAAPPEMTTARIVIPGVGHAGQFYASGGSRTGIAFDAGGRTDDFVASLRGQPKDKEGQGARVARSVAGIEMIDAMHVTHPHFDHVNRLAALAKAWGLQPQDVYISLLMARRSGELATQAEKAEEIWGKNALSRLGKANLYEPIGGDVLMGSSLHGGLMVEYYTTAQAQEHLQNGTPGDAHALDGASGLFVVRQLGTDFKVVILGDLRGKDIHAIKETMESNEKGSFGELFRGAQALVGFQHHLGVVDSADDVHGIKDILAVARTGAGNIDVLVQTDDNQKREGLIKMLQSLHVNIITAERGNAENPTYIKLFHGQAPELVGSDGKNYRSTEAYGNQESLTRLRNLLDVLDRYPEHLRGLGVDAEAVKASLATAVDEVKAAERDVFAQTIDRTKQPKPADGAKKQKNRDYMDSLRINEGALDAAERRLNAALAEAWRQVPAGLEKTVQEMRLLEHGADLNRAQTELDYHLIIRETENDYGRNATARRPESEQSDELDEILRKGYSPATIEELMAITGPKYAQQAIEQLRARMPRFAGTKRQREAKERAWMAEAFHEWMSTQAKTATAHQTDGWVARTNTAEGISEILQLVQGHLEREAEIRNSDRTASFTTLLWWLDKGVLPVHRGVIDRWGAEDETVTGLDKLLKGVEERTIDGVEVSVPDAEGWKRLDAWVTEHVQTYDDFRRHFDEAPGSPIRWLDGEWRLAVWAWDDGWPANMTKTWAPHERLTPIMNRALQRALANTGQAIDERLAKRLPVTATEQQNNALIGTPVGRRRFRQGFLVDKTLYALRGQRPIYFQKWPEGATFIELEGSEVPEGYALVTGGNAQTWAVMRETMHWVQDQYNPVVVKKGDKSPEAKTLQKLSQMGAAQFDSTLGGEADAGGYRFGAMLPNYQAVGLVKKESLEPAP